MTPTPEQIAAMGARGWTWDPAAGDFTVGGSIILLRVRPWMGLVWGADYGTRGVSYSPFNRHSTPLLAADEAEAWLRGVLGGLRFPWLGVAC